MSAPDRKVIQVAGPLHDRLKETQRHLEARLGRQVSFSEIIEQWRARAEGADVLAGQPVQP